jgi:hypothetical protein
MRLCPTSLLTDSDLRFRYLVVLSLLVPLLLLELGLVELSLELLELGLVELSLLLPVLLLPLFAPLELLPEPMPLDELLPVPPAPEE